MVISSEVKLFFKIKMKYGEIFHCYQDVSSRRYKIIGNEHIATDEKHIIDT